MVEHALRTAGDTDTILVIGAQGQLGMELRRSLSLLGRVVAVGRDTCDLSSAEQVVATMRSVKPRVVINAGGYTAVDAAETNAGEANAINAIAPGLLATEAKALGGLLVHYSTDYVFDGTGDEAYLEDDLTSPLSVYGRSKLDGEHAVREADAAHWIFRTSWVFGLHGANFLKSIVRAARTRDSLSVVADQIGAPTPASLLAEVTALAVHRYLDDAQPMSYGVYHVAAAGETSWHAYARHVVEMLVRAGVALSVSPERVMPITAADYGSAAARPANSRLDTSKLRAALNLTLPDWREGVDRVLAELVEGQRLLG
ncbi:dTDP-4-dehydrorhamnose reductase [Paraburkholderia domus]|uniref:dTDP-4-dehydrorhamnose reductase n=1 Tax=Paraburkholderia domus TaxID=2793075 RepID=UPI001912F8CC|nr:dTDP-4-dehydrorhamnose reductase [Paraburkholderia domus]MBK5123184.1 dTDP-4-dehydrorhamnose reductase [Burkholderia sp. R-69980]MBK5182348.1 dTDP-4-dehydrorhamnose reductase [Burkholderia sp. R-69749]CAE6824836.1 dTDP-4-dehydrorhamnose reductase [Paraburkholderia domus]